MSKDNILSGVKIIKRHSAPSVIIGILCLFAIAVPALYFIFPWFQIQIGGITNASASYQYEEGNHLLGMLDVIMCMFNKSGEATNFVIHAGWVSSQLRENVLNYYFIREILYAAGGWYFLSALMALVLFIQGFVLLIRGRVKNAHGIVVVALFYFLANGFILLDSWRLGYYIGDTIKKACEISGTVVDTYKFGLLYSIILASSAAFIFLLVFILYLAGIKGRYYMEDLEFHEVEQPQPFERNDGVTRNTLPKGLTSIGGHAFARNTNLEIATIEDGVTELGIGAFSNCLRLKVVTLPKSIKKIGANCFFNTPRLQRINYAGSKEEWRYITRGSNWLNKSMTTTVVCNDGAISVDPYK